ncbi:MAG: hypothetical protein AB7H88_20020 [Vicinamibacterales bacterium]
MSARAVTAVRWIVALAVLAPAAGLFRTAEARPPYLAALEADPMRRPEVEGCGTCHVSKTGGGARNEFGTAFDQAGREITPLLRAANPEVFRFASASLPDGSTFHFSDPASRFVVFERNKARTLVDLAALTAPKASVVPPAENRMSFFVTSTPVPGGKLGGLAGADRVCQQLADAAGAGDRTWRAYLSTSFQDAPAVNAGDRIGAGPWYDASGTLVARGPVDLHTKAALGAAVLRTETGAAVVPGETAIFTGTMPDGTAAVGRTCDNWTVAEGEAMGASPAAAWNSGQALACAPPPGGAGPRLYCFAVR